jgi:carboxymethylenebutenolidase
MKSGDLMLEEEIEIQTSDGVVTGYLYRGKDGRALPGIIHMTDIMGIRQASRDMARRLADEGYAVLLPNVCYRTGKPPLFDSIPNFGDDRVKKRFVELTGPLTPEAIGRDASSYVDFLAANKFVLDGDIGGGIGVVGYCFTGAIAMRIAAAMPGKIAALASFHGGSLFTDAPTSPHLTLPQIKARLYFGYASNDASMPEQAIVKFEQALKTWGGKYESEIYEGSAHGWTMPDRPVYNKPQAERAFKKMTELFQSTLKKA